MIPLQVYNTLRVPEERKRLEQTDILIIGGRGDRRGLGTGDTADAKHGLFHLRNDGDAVSRRPAPAERPEASPYYHPFSSVTLSLSPDNTLVIDAPLVWRRAAGDERCRPPAAGREFRHYRKER